MRRAANRRQYSRIAAVPHATPDSNRSTRPLVVNVSQGGACLWLNTAAPIEQDLVLRFEREGQTHQLQSQIIWSRRCTSTFTRSKLPRDKGWLAGIAFAASDSDFLTSDIPHNILRADDTKISFIDRSDKTAGNDSAVELHREPDSEQETLAVTALTEASIPGLAAATKDLVPVFAKHFSDVRLIYTRDRLEISASFRPLPQAQSAEAELQNQPAIQAMQSASDRVAQPAPEEVVQPAPEEAVQAAREELVRPAREEVVQPAPEAVVQQSAAEPAKFPATIRSKRVRIAMAGLLVVILGGTLPGILQKPDNAPEATESSVDRQNTPGWGVSMDDVLLDGWIEVKTRFDLPVSTVRSVIQIMQANDKYPSAHDLHDLAKYPAQAGRAFSLLAGSQSATGATLNIRDLKDDLESRLMAGARFPDEAPGGRYSSLQRELYNNVVVLGVIDLFYRHQDGPVVKAVLGAIRHDGPQQPHKQDV